MFELIGLAIATCLLFGVAAILGVFYAGVAWLVLPRGVLQKMRWACVSFSVPILCCAYMWVCVALLPGESLFGDVDQPLPNGYRLEALAKMPEYGHIDKIGPSIQRIDVNGPLVAAEVCQTCDEAFVKGFSPYILLDTRTGNLVNLSDERALNESFGRPVELVSNVLFKSQEAAFVREKRLDHAVMFMPPIALSLLLFGWLVRLRRESSKRGSHLY